MSKESDNSESARTAFIRLLSGGAFARYMAGESISMVGTWMQMFAQGWVMTSLTLEATKLGWLTFAAGIPTLLLAMFGGTIADRHDKRRILFAVLAVQIAMACLIGWLVQTDQIALWHLYSITVLLGVVAAFEMPTASAFVPELVAHEDLARALAMDRAVFHLTRMIGPALAGYLIGKFGTPSAYYLNALSFVALGIAISTIGPRARGSEEEEMERQGPMRAGFDFVRQDSPTRAMVLLMAAAATFVSPFFMVTMPVYSRAILGLDASYMGLLMACSGVGSFAGALTLLVVKKGHRAAYLKSAAAVGTLGLIALAAAPGFGVAVAGIILMTLGLSSTFGTANIIIQERAPNAIRGRVSAMASMAFFGTMPFAGLAMASFADHIGLRKAMGCGAAGFALAAFALLVGRTRLASAPVSAAVESGPPDQQSTQPEG